MQYIKVQKYKLPLICIFIVLLGQFLRTLSFAALIINNRIKTCAELLIDAFALVGKLSSLKGATILLLILVKLANTGPFSDVRNSSFLKVM